MNKTVYLISIVVCIVINCLKAHAENLSSDEILTTESMKFLQNKDQVDSCITPDTIPVIDIVWGFTDKFNSDYKNFLRQMLDGGLISLIMDVKKHFPYTRFTYYAYTDFITIFPSFYLFSNLSSDLQRLDGMMRQQLLFEGKNFSERVLHGIWTCASLSDKIWNVEYENLKNKKTRHYRFLLVSAEKYSYAASAANCSNNFSNEKDQNIEQIWGENCGPSYKQLAEILNYRDINLFFLPSSLKVDYYKSVARNILKEGYQKNIQVIEGDVHDPSRTLQKILEEIRSSVCIKGNKVAEEKTLLRSFHEKDEKKESWVRHWVIVLWVAGGVVCLIILSLILYRLYLKFISSQKIANFQESNNSVILNDQEAA